MSRGSTEVVALDRQEGRAFSGLEREKGDRAAELSLIQNSDFNTRELTPRVRLAGIELPSSSPQVAITDGRTGSELRREHSVERKQTLWGIASAQLKQDGVTSSARDIHNYVKQIVQANKNEHPGLAKNPNQLSIGQKLLIPGFRKDAEQPRKEREQPRKEREQPREEREQPRKEREQPREEREQPRKERAQPRGGDAQPRGGDAQDPLTTEKKGRTFKAVASHYGGPEDKGRFHGKTSANCELYDREGLTMAHKSLKFGSIYEVRNPDTQKSVQLRITDRGPYVNGRDFDVSYRAARELGMLNKGVRELEFTYLGAGPERIGPSMCKQRIRRR